MQPKSTKYNKQQRLRNVGLSTRGNLPVFGDFGLKAISRGMITAKQMESVRRALARGLKKSGKIIFRVFPDKPITKKPVTVRMGRGKADVEFWAMNIKPGRMICEIVGATNKQLVLNYLHKASYKLGIKTKIVERLPNIYKC